MDSSWKIAAEASEQSKLSSWLGSQPVRGLYIATGQYSSFGGSALVLMFGVLDIVGVEVRNREQVEVRESVEARERGRRQNKETTNAQTCDDMSDMSCDTLRHNVMCA